MFRSGFDDDDDNDEDDGSDDAIPIVCILKKYA